MAAWGAVALGAILLLGVCLPHRAQARAKEAQLDALHQAWVAATAG